MPGLRNGCRDVERCDARVITRRYWRGGWLPLLCGGETAAGGGLAAAFCVVSVKFPAFRRSIAVAKSGKAVAAAEAAQSYAADFDDFQQQVVFADDGEY